MKVFGGVLPQFFDRFVAKADSNQGTDHSTTWMQNRILPSMGGSSLLLGRSGRCGHELARLLRSDATPYNSQCATSY